MLNVYINDFFKRNNIKIENVTVNETKEWNY